MTVEEKQRQTVRITRKGSEVSADELKFNLREHAKHHDTVALVDTDVALTRYSARLASIVSQAGIEVSRCIREVDAARLDLYEDAFRQNVSRSGLRDWHVWGLVLLSVMTVWFVGIEIFGTVHLLQSISETRTHAEVGRDSMVILAGSLGMGVLLWFTGRYAFRPGDRGLTDSEHRSRKLGRAALGVSLIGLLLLVHVANRTHFSGPNEGGLWAFSFSTWGLYGLCVAGLQLAVAGAMWYKFWLTFAPIPGLFAGWRRVVAEQNRLIQVTLARHQKEANATRADVINELDSAFDNREKWIRRAKALVHSGDSVIARIQGNDEQPGFDTDELKMLLAAKESQPCLGTPHLEIDQQFRDSEAALSRLYEEFEDACSTSNLQQEADR